MKIFCIIPVYNTSRYLRKCVDSVLKQSHRDFEIILVNDCSTDDSALICREYSEKYPEKITFIDKKVNEGVDKARFTALNHVLRQSTNTGGVIFLDSDDYINRDALKHLSEAMETSDSDMVEMRCHRVLGPLKKLIWLPLEAQTITQPELFDKYYISFFGVNILPVNIWGKLYSIDVLRRANLSPSGFKMGEDLMFNLSLFTYIQKYTIIDYIGYNYRIGGLTSRYNPTFWGDLKEQFKLKRQEARKHSYTRAYRSNSIELRNILCTAAEQKIYYLHESPDVVKTWIREQLSDHDLWSDAIALGNSGDDDLKAIAQCDADYFYNQAVAHIRKTRWRRVAKKILAALIK